MKLRFSLNTSTRHRELLVYSQKNEVLNPKQAAWISSRPHAVFLPATCQLLGETEKSLISYDVNGLVSMRKFVKRHVITGPEYISMLTDLACVYGCCTFGPDRQFWQRSLLFDSKHVFINANAQLRFVFMPLDGIPFTLDSSPLILLRLLSDTKKLKFATPNDVALAQSLASFALNERDTFSFNAYRGFLRRECGIEINPDGTVGNQANQVQGEVPVGGGWNPPPANQPPYVNNGVAPNVPNNAVTTNRAVAPSLGDLVGQVPPAQYGRQQRPVQPGRQQRVVPGQRNVPQMPPQPPRQGPRYALYRVSTGETYYFTVGQQVVLGRGSTCTPQILGNPKLSREHARILAANNRITLTDLGSTNGTYVNGHPLEANKATPIPLGQHFYLG